MSIWHKNDIIRFVKRHSIRWCLLHGFSSTSSFVFSRHFVDIGVTKLSDASYIRHSSYSHSLISSRSLKCMEFLFLIRNKFVGATQSTEFRPSSGTKNEAQIKSNLLVQRRAISLPVRIWFWLKTNALIICLVNQGREQWFPKIFRVLAIRNAFE